VDDLRPDLGSYLGREVGTPHMDRLAASGLRFTSAWCQQALCNPSRASFLTGCRPLTTGVTDLKTHFREALPNVPTLPQWFKEHGYHTRAIGKIEHGNLVDEVSWSVPNVRPNRSLVYALPENKAINRPRQKGPPTENADVPDSAYRDGVVADLAVAAIADPPAAPFFLALGFHKPHLPFAAPSRYWDLHPPEAVALASNPYAPEGAPAVALHEWRELRAYLGVPQKGPLSEDLSRELIRGYRACVSYVDAQVGRVLDALEANGLADETLVVLFGDHGYYLGEHGLWAKMGLFDDAMAVPLIVRAPGGPAGRATDALVELVDLYPTLAELCGLPLPDHLEGTSFAPLVTDDPARPWKRAAFGVHTHGTTLGQTLRTPRYRLNRWSVGAGAPGTPSAPETFELYDHRVDPGENRNMVFEETLSQVREELMALQAAGWRQALPVESEAR
jgi:arylsulfatase A-like enzyme